MAKPKIFISSTFYDLKHIRHDLDSFIDSLGYEPIRNEEGNISYGKDTPLDEYCYKEIETIDILISIIGGRYGSSTSSNSNMSISQKEFSIAIEQNKQVYIFIDKNVLAEYDTYLMNKDNPNVKYASIDNIKIFEHIYKVKSMEKNNNIKGFETILDITKYLKEQFAGLFQRFLEQQTRTEEYNVIKSLKNTSDTLERLVDLMGRENKNNKSEVNKNNKSEVDLILQLHHPIIDFLREACKIPYNFYIASLGDLKELLKARGFKPLSVKDDDIPEGYLGWSMTINKVKREIFINEKLLFKKDGRLLNVMKNLWGKLYAYTEETTLKKVIDDDDDIPF